MTPKKPFPPSRKPSVAVRLLAAIPILLLAACGGGDASSEFSSDGSGSSGETGTIAFRIESAILAEDGIRDGNRLSDAISLVFPKSAIASFPEDCAGDSVSMSAVVYDEFDGEILRGGPWNCSTRRGRLEGVTSGSDRKLVLLVENMAGETVYRGESSGIEVISGQTTEVSVPAPEPFVPVWMENDRFPEWRPVFGASEYRVRIEDENGDLVEDFAITGESVSLPAIFGDSVPMWTRVYAMDAFGNEGAGSAVKWFEPEPIEDRQDRFVNSLGMEFVRIPRGTFMMGSPEDEPGRGGNETPHPVTLTRDYYMMTTEVTQAQWEAVTGSNPSYFAACGGDCPVERVSWYDVRDFIAALNAMDGRTYRLPTEAEWEYAARAGTTTAFYSGGIAHPDSSPVDPNLDAIGWYGGNSHASYTPNWLGRGTHPVARKQPNAFGLYDMSGNVGEWVRDWYGSYPDGAATDPMGPIHPGGPYTSATRVRPHTSAFRVRRGGSWLDDARKGRSASRSSGFPTILSHHDGFRLALSPDR
jgi:formylglycine-generating enzyme required for sulfatase activity